MAMPKVLLSQYKTVSEITVHRNQYDREIMQTHDRGKVKIAVIDDKPFEPGQTLRNRGYSIFEVGDLKKISEVSQYQIVLCDIMDVGMNFDTKSQGAALINEIRNNYPAILVAAYTGSSISSEPAKKAKLLADDFIKKDAVMDTWVKKLDGLISIANNPISVWQRTRTSLINNSIDTKDLLILEDAYVRAVCNGSANKQIIEQASIKISLKGATASIIQNLIASAIFVSITG